MATGDNAVQGQAHFCRLFTEATLGGMAFEVIARPADAPEAALQVATQDFIPVRASTPEELRAALNVIAADFAVHLGAAAPEDVEVTAEELRQIGDRWLAHVISLVTEATAAMRADGDQQARGDGAA